MSTEDISNPHTDESIDVFKQENLLLVVTTKMPFGKYSGRAIADLPEEYLLWFSKKEFPKGKLGELMSFTLEIKINGLEYLLEPIKTKLQNTGNYKANS